MCNKEGLVVSPMTVSHMVVENLVEQITGDHYYLCLDENCQVAYYAEDPGFQVTLEHIQVPIWFKRGADPKYICYCSRVTEDEIVNAVVHQGARSLKDIVKLTGAMENCHCAINHPTGKCCSPYILEAINKGKEKMKQC
ncbi:MAG: (2Fe-2S)-binding protein [Bacillota bacterium]|nr:(2Fe-2S)-binding protein [Bacillota bacterium]MDW7678418.1 (2Fe-2S)-binding protein [Bacillota bacterium]